MYKKGAERGHSCQQWRPLSREFFFIFYFFIFVEKKKVPNVDIVVNSGDHPLVPLSHIRGLYKYCSVSISIVP